MDTAENIGIGICSFSFHRLLAAGKQDMFRYIEDCKTLGCTQLDPWNAHLSDLKSGDTVLEAGHNPNASHHLLSAADAGYIARVKQAADDAGLPFGCIAVDGAHIYDEDPAVRNANRQRAYRWLDIAQQLGAAQVRIDAGGPEQMSGDMFAVIKDGYQDLIARAQPMNVEIIVENHWGPTRIPDNVIKLLENIPGLGLLLDLHNWSPELRREGRERCAKYARALHIKTFAFDEQGNETTADEDVVGGIQTLLAAGYKGTWGVESVPRDGDEMEGARKTIALIKRYVAAATA